MSSGTVPNLAKSAAMASIATMAACGGGRTEALSATETPGTNMIPVIDTADVDRMQYRLLGIDASKARQICRAWGRRCDCGATATNAPMSRAEGRTCECGDTGRFGRTVAVCYAGDADLNAWLIGVASAALLHLRVVSRLAWPSSRPMASSVGAYAPQTGGCVRDPMNDIVGEQPQGALSPLLCRRYRFSESRET